ncbi:mucin-5AC isoform X1 [Culex quinquefasciatus]|uniref:mucin-5AC isoform X1 n=1 Tax=Culex quinquefasciatus TaxID=7176 RepID=UPI0018E315CF|nr:mucin-5AC isoform X1 [Culex quinquefasciatus]XP_038115025.1 mucin-5AC isoform X1 [Culex quinquefasciatus]XP_038115026.1 mucin-5AC isoform X1 [Culex quinquefasciatus]XP_038115027.1 mucin-5AC isoform X1 [Culex quinquefasciatus]XP_038115028.1 mucin-5AC isoform X1 [Culex quinquefasciatus]XP_038115029.1 mucin-5AC isoform X1 [Culex quinquefasciatus]
MTVSVTQPQPPMDIACCPSSPSGGGTSSMATTTTTTAPPTSRPSSVVSPGQRSTSPANSSGGSSEADPSLATVGTPPSSSSSSTATNASTALRRFYFQKTRISKSPKAASIAGTGPPTVAAASGSVPKVVVMGSSTTSEATINTSTDSASTHVTNVTVTTDTETNDSIDLGEGSGQSEPLLSSLDDESSSIVMNQSFGDGDDENITVINGGPDTPLLISYQELEDLSPRSPRSPKPCRTAPVASTTRFPFDPPPSPRSVRILPKTTGHSGGAQHESMFNFDESPNPVRRPPPKMASPGEFHRPEVTVHGKDGNKENMAGTPTKRGSPYKSRKERFMQQQQQQHYGKQQSGKPLNSAPAASCQKGGQTYDPNMTMFPFDREAIDYDRIQRECFAVEEEFPFERNRDDYCCESPSRANMDSEIFGDHYSIFQQYAYLTQQERDALERTPTKRNKKDRIDAFSPKKQPQPPPPQLSPQRMSKFDQIATKFDMMPSKHELMTKGRSKRTSVSGAGNALPDLRVDFFAETSCCDNLTAAAGSDGAAGKTHAPSQPAGSSRTAAEVAGAGALATGAINVTPNPMDSAVCTQPRATIVVQQPSLSLDYSSVETILLKNEGDFISVEQGKELSRKKKQQQREDNMRQLLDVTNTLTTEEIKDFEMRYGSPHHSRSQSVKTPGSRASGRPNQLCLPQQRSRVASMPNTGVEEEYYRLRHFSITGKGVVNRGDSLKSRRSKSNNSVASSNSSTEHLTAVGAGSARTSATCSLASSRESSTSNPAAGPYKVLMLGGAAVGKSSLVSQFMTSEYLHAYDTSIDDDSGEKTVSVLLSGDESEITFIDHSYMEMTPENCMSSYDPHGYCVIYSSSDRSSFQIAEEILQVLWTSENIAQKAVILVANKADLARSRMVTSDEGKQMATQYDCKFIETSVGINHNVDELLVGLLSQIRLKLENPEKSRDLFRKRSIRKSKRRACSPLGGTICLSGMGGGTNPSTPVAATPSSASGGGISGIGGGGGGFSVETPPGSAHSSPRKYRGSRTSASLKVKGLLGRVWARDSKSKSCENLHVL